MNSKFMGNDEKSQPGRQSNSSPSGEIPGAEDTSLEGLQRVAREVVYQTPEVRPDKVARLKEAVDRGTYEIDAAKLAEILIEELNLKR